MRSDRLRLFIALELPEAAREHLGQIPPAARGIGQRSWTPARNLHLTLKFLGDVPTDRLAELRRTLERVPFGEPFETHAAGFCCFPNARRARILAADLSDPAGQLAELQRRIDDACETLGFAKETRPFHAHVTLARGRPTLPRDAVGHLQHRSAMLFPGPRWTADGFTLMKSILGGAAPVYEAVARFPRPESAG